VRLTLDVAGHNVGLSRMVVAQADRWFNRIALPVWLRREWSLPRKIEVTGSGGWRVVSSQTSRYTLSKLRLKANDDAIEFTSEIAVGSP